LLQRNDEVGDILYSDARRREKSLKQKQQVKVYEETKDVGKGSFINKSSHKIILTRFLADFDAACLDRGYNEVTSRLDFEEAIRFVQDVGYLTDPRRFDPEAPKVSVIEEKCASEMWKHLSANCKEASDHGQRAPDVAV
jgi:hypothetical protein